MTAVLAALAGAAVTTGLVLVLVGARRTTAPPRPGSSRPRVRSWAVVVAGHGWTRWRWLVAGGAALVVWAVSGWPVAGLIAAATVIGLPVLLGTGKVAAARIARVEAIEEWARRLSDILVTGVGLEQAITTSLRTCPAPLRLEVTALVARLAARWPTERALRVFADDVDDAAADLVVAALVLGARRRGPGLARVLAAVCASVAEDVAVRRKVEAERAKPRATARAVTLITLTVVGVGSLNGEYLRPYATGVGQVVLALIAAAFVGCLGWMRALTLSAPEPRFLTDRREAHR